MSPPSAKSRIKTKAAPKASARRASTSAQGRNLVVVESPAKARTIAQLLGGSYIVKASIGHVRDLPKSTLGVDLDHDFQPRYIVPRDKRAVVSELKEAAKGAKAVFLATDPDREGEAISWHLVQAVDLSHVPVRRVVFHEITPEAIKEAFAQPRDIDVNLVDAQQARRVMDRMVGYSLSPILWRKIRGHLSAGRVQSVALRMVVEREREIQNFVSQEFWSIDAELAKEQGGRRRGSKAESFHAELVNLVGQRGRIHIANQTAAERLAADLRPAAYQVSGVATRRSPRQPEPPFTTSTLQQEASRKLRFTAQRTMQVAQQLYEGLDVGAGERAGLITYMRTDSVQVAEVAIRQTRQYVQQAFGADFLPGAPRRFTRRSRGAQEAHEAIRPTSIQREPVQVRAHLTADQYRLYDLIWKRMVASQMAAASIESVTVSVEARNADSGNAYLLRAVSSRVVFPGYQVLYQVGTDDAETEDRQRLPSLAQGEPLSLQALNPQQHFTQPPARYTDATLIKALEANGIGRPSTYAAILMTLQGRGYVGKEGRQFVAEELGVLVSDLLTEHFSNVVNVQFTAQMEEELDDIAAGKRTWVPVVREFYDPFKESVDRADAVIPKVELTPEPTGEQCEKCGLPMVFRVGRFGRFQACSGFPECRNAKPILKLVGVPCPKDGGELVEKRARVRRRVFYGCANFPACDFTSWDRPLPDPCPQCGGLVTRSGYGRAKCSQCGHSTTISARRRSTTKRQAKEAVPVGA